MPGRKYNGGYRYGFNGKEQDKEIYGEGNIYDYGFRIYNPRLGKFLSVDPLTKSYPWYTPYQFAGNTPIQAIDLDGLEEFHYTLKKEHGFYCIDFSHTDDRYGLDTKLFSFNKKIPEGEKYFILHYQSSYWGDMTWEFKSPGEMMEQGVKGPNALGFHREGKREAIQNAVNSYAGAMTTMPATSPSYQKLKGKPKPSINNENSESISTVTKPSTSAANSPTPTQAPASPITYKNANSSQIKSFISTEPGAQSSENVSSIQKDLNSSNPFLWAKPVFTTVYNGRTYILDGHNRLKAAATSSSPTNVPLTELSNDEARKMFKDKMKDIEADKFKTKISDND